MLILAGVSIATLTGENGILTRANDAREQTQSATAEEKVAVEVAGSYGTDGKIDQDLLNKNLENVEGLETQLPISLPATVVVDGYEIMIGANGSVGTITRIPVPSEKSEITKPYLPGNDFTVVESSLENGIVVTDGTNYWTWIEVPITDVFKTAKAEDEYDEATMAEVKMKGLRAGLRSMGYKLSTVSMKASAQVKANVAKLTASAKAEMKAKVEARDKVLHDSLILAAVGLNRNIFKDYENSLRNELVASLQNAGVRNASRMVRAAFEKYGIDYSKKLMTIASDIAELPEETREGLATQLDMTLEADEDIMADPNLYGDPVTEAEEDEDLSMPSVEAALRNPIKASTVKNSVSVDAQLPFIHI